MLLLNSCESREVTNSLLFSGLLGADGFIGLLNSYSDQVQSSPLRASTPQRETSEETNTRENPNPDAALLIQFHADDLFNGISGQRSTMATVSPKFEVAANPVSGNESIDLLQSPMSDIASNFANPDHGTFKSSVQNPAELSTPPKPARGATVDLAAASQPNSPPIRYQSAEAIAGGSQSQDVSIRAGDQASSLSTFSPAIAPTSRSEIGSGQSMMDGGEGELPAEPIPFLGIILKEVTFNGPNFSSVYRDAGTIYDAPHWRDGDEDGKDDNPGAGDRKYPVAFKRNDMMDLTVKYKVTPGLELPADPTLQLYLGGYSPSTGGHLSRICIGRPTSSYTATVQFVAQDPLPNHVRAFDPFQVQWICIWANQLPSYSDPNWRAFGASSNPLYVTYGKSLSNAYHSLVFNATISAEGKSTWQDVLNANWSQYTNYSIVWKEYTPYDPENPTIPTKASRMFYYGPWAAPSTFYTDLIKTGDGECGAWATFWKYELQVQGITEVDPVLVEILPPDDDNVNLFLVNSWSFKETGSSNDFAFPFKATFQGGTPRRISNTVLADNKYVFDANSDFSDEPGIAGQGSAEFGFPNGNPNPPAEFNRHYVISMNNRIYDPSYGKDYPTIAAWEDASIKAFVKVVSGSEWNARLNEPGVREVRTNPSLP